MSPPSAARRGPGCDGPMLSRFGVTSPRTARCPGTRSPCRALKGIDYDTCLDGEVASRPCRSRDPSLRLRSFVRDRSPEGSARGTTVKAGCISRTGIATNRSSRSRARDRPDRRRGHSLDRVARRPPFFLYVPLRRCICPQEPAEWVTRRPASIQGDVARIMRLP